METHLGSFIWSLKQNIIYPESERHPSWYSAFLSYYNESMNMYKNVFAWVVIYSVFILNILHKSRGQFGRRNQLFLRGKWNITAAQD